MTTFDDMVIAVTSWFMEAPEEEQKLFLATSKDDLVRYHDSTGREIRNRFKLWERKWTPDVRNGIDHSPEHPDNISQEVLEAVWERVKVLRTQRPIQ